MKCPNSTNANSKINTKNSTISIAFVIRGNPTPMDNASARYRVLEVVPFLKDHLMELSIVTRSNTNATTLNRAKNIITYITKVIYEAAAKPIIYFQRMLFPRPILEITKQLPVRIVFDFDDAIHATPPWEDSPRQEMITRLQLMFEVADHVVAGSATLADYARSNGATAVTTLPTAVPRDTYCDNRKSNSSSGETIIGWIGYGPNLRYLNEREGAIRNLLETNDRTFLRIMTGGEISTKPLDDHPDVSYNEWSWREEIEFLRGCDIGIRPLPDTEWARAKGGYTSVVQFMALAKPVVVSPIGGLTDIVIDGETGFYATNDEEWIAHLNELIQDEVLRQSMGKSARDRISEIGMWTEDYADGLLDVIYSTY